MWTAIKAMVSGGASTAFSFLTGLSLRTWLYIALAGVILSGVLYWRHLENANADLKTDNVTLETNLMTSLNVNKDNLKTIDDVMVNANNGMDAVVNLYKGSDFIDKKFADLNDVIVETKPEDDGKVSNVLKNTIQRIDSDK